MPVPVLVLVLVLVPPSVFLLNHAVVVVFRGVFVISVFVCFFYFIHNLSCEFFGCRPESAGFGFLELFDDFADFFCHFIT